MLDPRAEYTRRLELDRQGIAERERAHIRAGNFKLAAIVAGLIVLWLSLIRHAFSGWWFFAVAAIYIALAVYHQRVIRARTRAETAAAFYQRGLARIDDRWADSASTPPAFGERFRDESHVYSPDLNLFERGDLFQLLSLARLPMGEQRLADWLRSPSPLPAVLERQSLVSELRDNLDLREALALTAEELRAAKLNPEALIGWSEQKRAMPGVAICAIAILFAIGVLVALFYSFAISSYWPIVSALLAQSIFYYWLRARARAVVALDSGAEALHLFSQILHRLEREKFSSPRLQKLANGFTGRVRPASRSIRQLARIMSWMEPAQTRPMVVKLLDRLFAFTIHVAFAADAWRSRFGSRMAGCVDAVAEIEALLSLAGYSFEHPADPFPQFVDADGSVAQFDGIDLRHPLIPAAISVGNSVSLGPQTRLLIVSGSNMSGKSTLLRTVGINVVLAMAGAPIRGQSLRLTPITLGAHMQSSDSLQEGRSNFYTEILRLRQVFDLGDATSPLLFLFDELLEGTNSHDRRIGGETLLHALVGRSAVGVVTTHDLALTEIAPSFEGLARNTHFQDFVEEGKMRFDYKLHEGVVTRSNALELMRLIGLKV